MFGEIGYLVNSMLKLSSLLVVAVPVFLSVGCDRETEPATVITNTDQKTEYEPDTSMEYNVDFPTVFIYTDGFKPISSKEEYVQGRIVVTDPSGDYCDTPRYEGRMKIKGRGNTTWGMPKKPWRIKLDEKSDLYGMPADKDWVLLANYSDKTLLRNLTAMKLSEICGFPWTPRLKTVEVYLNGSYQGCYTLGEHKKVADARVNIKDGYYLEIDSSMDENCCFITDYGVPVMFSDPEDPTQEQETYIRNYIKEFETVLFGNSFPEGYGEYLDIDSMIDYFIVQELSKNIDGDLRKSTFLTKEEGKKMEFYHLWDFDIAFGNADYFTKDFGADNGPEGWYVKEFSAAGRNTGWIWRAFQDPAFVDKVQARWNVLKPRLEKEIPQFIDAQAEFIDDSQRRNFEKWDILDEFVWPNLVCMKTYAGEVDYLKDFYLRRLQWIDTNLNEL